MLKFKQAPKSFLCQFDLRVLWGQLYVSFSACILNSLESFETKIMEIESRKEQYFFETVPTRYSKKPNLFFYILRNFSFDLNFDPIEFLTLTSRILYGIFKLSLNFHN